MTDGAAGLPYGDVRTITGDENALILVPNPGDETLACGGLIAACCRHGRPPFVMVLGDGTGAGMGEGVGEDRGEDAGDAAARVRGRQTRAAVGCLGLEGERLLMAGLRGGAVPAAGPVSDAIVRAVTLVMWRRDCNVLCAPWPAPGRPADVATWRIAGAVAAGSGVGLLGYGGGGPMPRPVRGWRLDVAPYRAAKEHALAAHGLAGPGVPRCQDEVFLQLG